MRYRNPLKARLAAVWAGGVAVLLLAGCGERPPEKITQGSLAARVNGREISVQQIEAVMHAGVAGVAGATSSGMKKQLLERLIEQELAVQKALEASLDRNQGVVEALGSARREILARAYIEQAAGEVPRPGMAEIRKFHDEHPELFGARKIYRLEEIAFNPTAELIDLVRGYLQAGKPTSEIMASLKGRGVAAAGGVTVKPAEQLTLEILPRLAAAREGQTLLFEVNGKAALITVLGSKAEPVDEPKALALAEEYLVRMQQTQAVANAVRGMRDVAKIEYFGEFSSVSLALGEAGKDSAGEVIGRQTEKGGH